MHTVCTLLHRHMIVECQLSHCQSESESAAANPLRYSILSMPVLLMAIRGCIAELRLEYNLGKSISCAANSCFTLCRSLKETKVPSILKPIPGMS